METIGSGSSTAGQGNGISVMEAIKSRRSIGKVKPDEVEREIIEALLEAATWAPSHFNTQPWRFVVMTGEGRSKLGEGYAKVLEAASAGVEGAELEEKLQKERAKAFRAPLVITAICSPSDDPRAERAEELAAAQAAVHNLLLAAHAYGLGAIWRSGPPMYDPVMKRHFELREDEEIVAFLYIGYPDMTPGQPRRSPVADKTIWLDS
ncbi:nitroreductase [Paenibacillus sp. PL2-23]|uniref:nitroreductase family protein n=1 Tax=Paenibacillus sp. PL2-23 TaxID=2100729 RepID=UPI0030FC4365